MLLCAVRNHTEVSSEQPVVSLGNSFLTSPSPQRRIEMRPRPLNAYSHVLLSMIALPFLPSPAMSQASLPIITAAQAGAGTNHLVINGSAFGSIQPGVSLAGNQLTVSSFTDKQIVAVLPDGLNGDYLLTVTNNSS